MHEKHTVAVADTGVTAISWRRRRSRFRRKMTPPTTPTTMTMTVTVPSTEILKRACTKDVKTLIIECVIMRFDSMGLKKNDINDNDVDD